MRKQIILTLLLTMSLAACVIPIGGASTAPSATATILPTATATQTPTPSTTLRASPEPTATPTETPTPTEIPIDLPIVRNFEINKFQSLPYISSEDAVSPAFNAFLDKQEAAGNLGDFPDIRYLAGYEFGTDRWQVWPRPSELAGVEQRGQPTAIVGISDIDFSSSTFADPIRKPEYNQAYFKTKINNVDYLLFVSEVLNKDGSRARIKYVIRYDRVERYWNKYFDPKATKYVTLPQQYPDNTDFKTYTDGSDKNYFNNYWQAHKTEMKTLIAKMQMGNVEFTPDFNNFLWNATILPTTIP